MRIRRPLGLSGFEIGLGVFLGVIGGIYIWKPIFEEKIYKRRQTIDLETGKNDF